MRNELRSSYEITLVAILSAIAIVGRVAVQALPNIQPATFIIVIGGIIFGRRVGVELGLVIAIVSGLLTGLGSWTLFQIAGWALVGFISGYIGEDSPKWLKAFWIVGSAFVFGFISSLSMLVFVPFDMFLPLYLLGIPFDFYHALGNVIMAATLPFVVPLLLRYREKGRKISYVK